MPVQKDLHWQVISWIYTKQSSCLWRFCRHVSDLQVDTTCLNPCLKGKALVCPLWVFHYKHRQISLHVCLHPNQLYWDMYLGRHWTVDTAAGRGAVASLHCGRAHAGTCDRRHHWRWQLSKHRDSLSIWRNAETQWRAAGGALAEWAELVGQWIQVTSAPCYTPFGRDDRWANNYRDPAHKNY